MTNYGDWREWTEVELQGDEVYLSEFNEYSVEDIAEICSKLFEKGKEKGLEGCFLKFQSHCEPYEQFLGNPSVTVCGYRNTTQEEKRDYEYQDKIEALAKNMGVTPYEASIYLKLKESGKI